MQFDLTGQKALVTGGAIGLGRSIALALAEAGADIAVTYHSHDADEVTNRVAEFGRKAVAHKLDATDSAAVRTAIDQVAADLQGRIDILINNAGGLVGRRSIGEMPDDHWHQVLDLNLSSAFYCSREVIRHMGDGGRIINISSLAGRNGGGGGAAAYGAAKAGMHGLTRGLAKEVASQGITVNAVAPGFILDTPFHPMYTPEEEQHAQIAGIPVGRAGTPEDVAAAVAYLASPAGGFCTGAVIDLNGGSYFS